jgi:hypothetical protein
VGASSFGASTFASKMSLREMAREERRRAKRARQDLEEALKNLPAPQFDYELAAPEDVTTEEDDDTHDGVGLKKKFRVKDAADEDAEELERLRKEAERLYEEQSSVMKRSDLPKPRVTAPLDRLNTVSIGMSAEEKDLETAAKLVNEEMMILVAHDTVTHPVVMDKSDPVISWLASDGKGKKEKKRKHQSLDVPPSLDYFSEEALSSAKLLLEDELKAVIKEKRDLLLSKTGVFYENDADVLNAAGQNAVGVSSQSKAQLQFNMDDDQKGWAGATDDSTATMQNLRAEYTAIQHALKPLAKSCAKLQQKLEIQTGGYNQRTKALIDSSYQSFAELQHSKIEESVYSCLRSHETRGARLRIEKVQEEVEHLEEEEAKKQKRYGELVHMKARLMLKMNGGQAK